MILYKYHNIIPLLRCYQMDNKEVSYDVLHFIKTYFTPACNQKLWQLLISKKSNIKNLKQLATLIKTYERENEDECDESSMILRSTTYGICLEFLDELGGDEFGNYIQSRGGNWNWFVEPMISVRDVFSSLRDYEKSNFIIVPKKVIYKDKYPNIEQKTQQQPSSTFECTLCYVTTKNTECGCEYFKVTSPKVVIGGSAWNKPLVFKK